MNRAKRCGWLERIGHGWPAVGQLDLRDLALLCRASGALLRARLDLDGRTAARLVRRLHGQGRKGPRLTDRDVARVEQIAWAVRIAARRVPWRSDCLIQSLAGERMLRRAGFRAEFCLGATRGDGGEFHAHAWLCCDSVVLSDGPVDRYSRLL